MSSPWFNLVSKELLGAKNHHQARKWRASGLFIHKKLYNHHSLSTDTTKTLISAFVPSCPYYYNSVLPGCPLYLLNKLQKVQNNTACLVMRVPKTDIISHLILLFSTGCPLSHKYSTNLFLCSTTASTQLLMSAWLNLWKLQCSSSDTSISLSSICAHTLAWSEIFFLCCTICPEQSPLQS